MTKRIECSLCGGARRLECDEEGNEYRFPIKCTDCNGTGYIDVRK